MNWKLKSLRLSCKFIFGGAAYNSIEMMWRGYTHISMTFLGGLCFCMLLYMAGLKYGLFPKIILSGSLITAAEFIAGCVVNIWLGLEVWDYGDEFFNLLGQVSLRFFVLWCLLSAAVILPCIYFKRNVKAFSNGFKTLYSRFGFNSN